MVEFVYDIYEPGEANVIVFGVPLGPNSHTILRSLRMASREVEPFDLQTRKNLLEGVKLADIGNLKIKQGDLDAIFRKAASIREAGKLPLILGGEHLLTLYSLGIASPSTHIVIFDAHLDARDAERGNRFTHATWLRRFCELATGCSILLLGVRSCSEEELGFAEENKLTYFTPTQLRREKQRVLELVVRFCKAEEIYLSIDMDAFDPSIAPAVRCPEPNGLLWDEFVELIECLRGGKLIGIDLVEVRSLGENRVTEFLAINAIFRVLNLTRHKI